MTEGSFSYLRDIMLDGSWSSVMPLIGYDRKSNSVPKPHPGANYSNRGHVHLGMNRKYLSTQSLWQSLALCAPVSRTDNIGVFTFIQRYCEWRGTIFWKNRCPRKANWPEVEGREVKKINRTVRHTLSKRYDFGERKGTVWHHCKWYVIQETWSCWHWKI